MTTKTHKDSLVHCDKLGREINPGDIVATPGYNSLDIMRVVEFTPKMVRLAKLNKQSFTKLKYPADTVVLDSSDVTMYVLKNC